MADRMPQIGARRCCAGLLLGPQAQPSVSFIKESCCPTFHSNKFISHEAESAFEMVGLLSTPYLGLCLHLGSGCARSYFICQGDTGLWYFCGALGP